MPNSKSPLKKFLSVITRVSADYRVQNLFEQFIKIQIRLISKYFQVMSLVRFPTLSITPIARNPKVRQFLHRRSSPSIRVRNSPRKFLIFPIERRMTSQIKDPATKTTEVIVPCSEATKEAISRVPCSSTTTSRASLPQQRASITEPSVATPVQSSSTWNRKSIKQKRNSIKTRRTTSINSLSFLTPRGQLLHIETINMMTKYQLVFLKLENALTKISNHFRTK